jgi:hypothetical protein
VVLRLIQGFAVGGEIAGASAMIVEHSPFGRRGYFGSFTLQGVQAGQVLAAAVFLPLSAAMSPEAFQSWGWRIPFLLSVGVVIAGIIIRAKVDETPAFQEEAAHGEVPKAPIKQAVSESGPDMLRVFCMSLMNVVPTTSTRSAPRSRRTPPTGTGSPPRRTCGFRGRQHRRGGPDPFVGNLTDKIGRRPCMIVGALGFRGDGVPLPLRRRHPRTRCSPSSRDADVGHRLPGLQRDVPGVLPGAVPDPDARHRVRRLAEPGHDGHRVPAGRLRDRGASRVERPAHRGQHRPRDRGHRRPPRRSPRERPTACT